MKTLNGQLGPITTFSQFEKTVNEFARHLPKLTTQSGAYGKCKFASYELAMYLRKRGVKAKVMHVQGIQPNVYPNPHRKYVGRPKADWSHYVVKVGKWSVDLTVRQFDTSLPYPFIQPMSELRKQWITVENDRFINRWIRDLLKHKDVA